MKYICKKCNVECYAETFDEILENGKLCIVCQKHHKWHKTILKDVKVKKYQCSCCDTIRESKNKSCSKCGRKRSRTILINEDNHE